MNYHKMMEYKIILNTLTSELIEPDVEGRTMLGYSAPCYTWGEHEGKHIVHAYKSHGIELEFRKLNWPSPQMAAGYDYVWHGILRVNGMGYLDVHAYTYEELSRGFIAACKDFIKLIECNE